MRGMPTGTGDATVLVNDSEAETGSQDIVDVSATGFKITNNNAHYNENGETIYYIAVRRPDGYVGKPPTAGTDVFTQAYGNYSSGNNPIPNFTAGFPVDFAWAKSYDGTGNWWTSARLLQGREIQVDTTMVEQSGSNKVFDSNVGWHNNNGYDWYISHMWKRGAGFDVVTYTGTGDNSNSGPNSTSQIISHNLGRVPEMIWVKCRSTGYNWYVYHSGQNGGTNPWNYYLRLNHTDAEQESVAPYTNAVWNNTAPTSTQFSLGPGNDINANNDSCLLYTSPSPRDS